MSKRVLIGMSGGIDSTVAAILLLEQGYELVGATFRTFDPTPIANTQSPISNTQTSLEGEVGGVKGSKVRKVAPTSS